MQGTLLRNIHRAYFEDNRNIGDFDVLSDLAQASGVMSKDEVRRESVPRKDRGFADASWFTQPQALKFLESDECREEVINMMAEARKKGVTGVPFTIIDGRWAVIGGQTAEVYIQVRVSPFARGRACS